MGVEVARLSKYIRSESSPNSPKRQKVPKMKRRLFFSEPALLAAVVLALVFGQAGCAKMPEATNSENDENARAVRAVIDAQAEAWNRGDIDGFMKGYEESDDIVFVSGDTVTRGWRTVLDRYKKNYDSLEKMGKLDFTELEIKPISPFYAVVIGRWHLARAADSPHGRFTLIFRRTAQGWRIVHDHTSTATT